MYVICPNSWAEKRVKNLREAENKTQLFREKGQLAVQDLLEPNFKSS